MSLRHGLNGVVDPALTSSFSSIIMGRGGNPGAKWPQGKCFLLALSWGRGGRGSSSWVLGRECSQKARRKYAYQDPVFI